MQVKVLRVLQNGTFTPVGDTEMRKVDVRIVAATHRPLRDMVDDGRFREDLYYRLNVINLHLPPLRERLDDLPVLCDHFLDTMARRTGRRRKQLGAGCLDRFFAYPWPGNIRELENEIERLVVLSGDKDVISAEVVSERIGRTTSRIVERAAARGTLQEAMGELERHMIAEGLVRTHWNKRQLAARLGISRTTLLKKIKEYELEGPRAAFRF
jgi:TyrR family helix-turn-helix protein